MLKIKVVVTMDLSMVMSLVMSPFATGAKEFDKAMTCLSTHFKVKKNVPLERQKLLDQQISYALEKFGGILCVTKNCVM